MAVNIPQFRYLEGYKKFVDELKKSIKELGQIADRQETLLASSLSANTLLSAAATDTFTINLTPDEKEAKTRLRKLARKVDPKLVKVVVPNQKALEKQYALCEELYEKYRTLEAVESQVSTRFEGTASKKFRTELTTLKNQVEKALKKTFDFISKLAQKHVPASFQKYMDAVSSEVQEHVHAQDVELMLYVSVYSGSLVFSYYLKIENAINDDGSITPVLYVAVQWVVGNDKVDPSTMVYLDHGFETPNDLLRQGDGISVSSAMSAVKAVGELLSLENFSTELGVVPLSLAFLRDPANISKDLFNVRDLISKLSIDGTTITFTIKSKVPKADYGKIGNELYPQVKQLLKNQRSARLRKNEFPGKREIVFTTVGVAGPLDINMQDAEFFKDRFGISDTALRKIVRILNQE